MQHLVRMADLHISEGISFLGQCADVTKAFVINNESDLFPTKIKLVISYSL